MRGIGIDVCKAWLDFSLDNGDRRIRVANDKKGIEEVLALIANLGEVRVLIESTGGYEKLALDLLSRRGVVVMQVNPQRAREFARAMGYLMKTDRVDALVLAKMALVMGDQFRCYERKEAWQEQLSQFVDRHDQVRALLSKTRQQTRRFAEKELLRGIQKTIQALERELALLNEAIERLLAPHARQAFQNTKGIGPKLTAAMLSMLPELGRISNKAIASLIGVAPFNQDSGNRRGYRRTTGGRAHIRQLLYMGSLSAIRFDPDIRVFFKRLKEAGKPGKVALVAVMRKMLVRLNARRRDELNGTLVSAKTLQTA